MNTFVVTMKRRFLWFLTWLPGEKFTVGADFYTTDDGKYTFWKSAEPNVKLATYPDERVYDVRKKQPDLLQEGSKVLTTDRGDGLSGTVTIIDGNKVVASFKKAPGTVKILQIRKDMLELPAGSSAWVPRTQGLWRSFFDDRISPDAPKDRPKVENHMINNGDTILWNDWTGEVVDSEEARGWIGVYFDQSKDRHVVYVPNLECVERRFAPHPSTWKIKDWARPINTATGE